MEGELFHATIDPAAVNCKHRGEGCFEHGEYCEGRCGVIMRETVYHLHGTGFGIGAGMPARKLTIKAPADRVAVTDEQLRSARAENGLPLFHVQTLGSDREEMGFA